MEIKKKRELSEQQQKFIDALLGDAKGNYKEAMRIAGYSENTRPSDVIKGVRDELIEATKNYLATQGPKAAIKLGTLLDDPAQSGAANLLKAAQVVLDRAGIKTDDDIRVSVPNGGLFIMPAKQINTEKEEGESDGENTD